MTKPLTPKQAHFVEEYLVELNATPAAIRAGYSEKRASEIGYQLLQKTTVQEALTQAMAVRSSRVEVSQDWVIERLIKNVDRAMQAVPVIDREGKKTGEYSYQGVVANKAIELQGKHSVSSRISSTSAA